MRRLSMLAIFLSVVSGCAYGAMTTGHDGTIYVVRNDNLLFGVLRTIYACKPQVTVRDSWACTALTGTP